MKRLNSNHFYSLKFSLRSRRFFLIFFFRFLILLCMCPMPFRPPRISFCHCYPSQNPNPNSSGCRGSHWLRHHSPMLLAFVVYPQCAIFSVSWTSRQPPSARCHVPRHPHFCSIFRYTSTAPLSKVQI